MRDANRLVFAPPHSLLIFSTPFVNYWIIFRIYMHIHIYIYTHTHFSDHPQINRRFFPIVRSKARTIRNRNVGPTEWPFGCPHCPVPGTPGPPGSPVDGRCGCSPATTNRVATLFKAKAKRRHDYASNPR